MSEHVYRLRRERNHRADIATARHGYNVALRYEFDFTGPGEEPSWLPMTDDRGRSAWTRAGAERLGRRMIRRHLAERARKQRAWSVALCTCPANMTMLDCPAQGIGCRWDR